MRAAEPLTALRAAPLPRQVTSHFAGRNALANALFGFLLRFAHDELRGAGTSCRRVVRVAAPLRPLCLLRCTPGTHARQKSQPYCERFRLPMEWWSGQTVRFSD